MSAYVLPDTAEGVTTASTRRLKSVRLGPVSFRLNVRTLGLIGIAFAALVLFSSWALTLGSFPVPVSGVINSVLGRGSDEYDFIVRTLRLPRLLAALMVGAALGMSGAIFQGLVRNPLVSPDIIGINQGATAVAVFWIVTGQPVGMLAPVAFAGATVTALLVYVLSWRGGVAPSRLVLVGIGINAVAAAGTTYILVKYPIERVGSAVAWSAGSVYASTWDDVAILSIALLILTPLAAILMWHLRILQFGDDTAASLGLPVEPTRLLLVLVGCGCSAIAVSLAGPIGFVALMVPHIARMLGGAMTGSVLILTAILGALLLLASDVVGQHFLPVSMPVGVVTAVVGAPYFLFLLYRANARL
ncbi:MAG: iron chelate uptake ABC transporter family permease subunit [Dehalococcoidia bacterium]|nr:iron chelate uptake ABC transporter family permease subunit [Dehalococcoidia bacterium]